MNFTSKDVMTLRERTGVGMKACADALKAADGDMEKAIDVLREKGLAAQAKKSGRVAAEGMVYAMADENVGVIVEVNSETDFVAKNERFQNFVKGVAAIVAAENPASVEALQECAMDDGTVATALQANVLAIGENQSIRRFTRVEGKCVTYMHDNGRIGVLVNFESTVPADVLNAVGKDIAMQIASMNPEYLDDASVPENVIAHEREVLLSQIANDPKMASKPDAVKEKMVDGRIRKFYEQNCLVNQEFIKNGDQTVAQYVAESAKAAGGELSIKGFVRYERGEGIEKRQDDLAAEIAKTLG